MEEQFKRRLVGAAVLVSLAVIFIPMLFDKDAILEPPLLTTQIPPKPEQQFDSKLLKDEVPMVEPISREQPVKVEVGEATGESAEPVPATRVGLKAWVVQVGSFSGRENATQLADKLKAAGFEGFVEDAVVSGSSLYRVKVGPEADRHRAEALLPQIKAAVGLDGTVTRYP